MTGAALGILLPGETLSKAAAVGIVLLLAGLVMTALGVLRSGSSHTLPDHQEGG